jgi:DNA helicase-2/ATP-dependent DNA helicase PcrA
MLIPAARLTSEQRAIVAQRDGVQRVFATAGSGKSTLLAHWAHARLSEGMPAERMLCATFSHAGRRRLQALIGETGPKVFTFHALGRWACQRLVRAGWLENLPPLLDPGVPADAAALRQHLEDAVASVAAVWPDLDAIDLSPAACDDLLRRFARIKAERRFVHFHADDDPAEQAEWVGIELPIWRVYCAFERLRAQRGFLTFADLIHLPLECLADQPRAARVLAGQFDALLVDEANDLSLAQLALLHAVAGRAAVVVVGDEQQCIHPQQGADAEVMHAPFMERFPDAVTRTLAGTFRFGRELAAAVNGLMGHAVPSPRLQCVSQLDRPTRITRVYQDDVPTAVLAQIARLAAAGVDPGDVAVLFRSAPDALPTEFALRAAGYPVAFEGRPPLGEREEDSALLGLLAMGGQRLQALPDARRRAWLDAALRLIAPGIERVDDGRGTAGWYAAALDSLTADPTYLADFGFLTHAARRMCEQWPGDAAVARRAARLERLQPTLLSLTDDAPAAQALEGWLEGFAVQQELAAAALDRERARARWAHLHALVVYARAQRWTVKAMLAAFSVPHRPSHALGRVTLTTFAQAKGHEWPVVVLAGLERTQVPARQDGHWLDSATHSRVERRLFYVAMTRACRELVLVMPDDPALKAVLRQGSQSPMPPDHRASRYLFELALRAARAQARD